MHTVAAGPRRSSASLGLLALRGVCLSRCAGVNVNFGQMAAGSSRHTTGLVAARAIAELASPYDLPTISLVDGRAIAELTWCTRRCNSNLVSSRLARPS